MELNKKILLNALSQIKAYKDIIVFQDSASEGCIDILYAPKVDEPKAFFKMVVRVAGTGADLFDDSPVVEKLGSPVPIYLSRIRGALKDAETCVFENGCVNGIRVTIEDNTPEKIRSGTIVDAFAHHKNEIKSAKDILSVSFRKNEWEYSITECSKFVCTDTTRYFMNGICFDFSRGGEDCVNVVATDGRKLMLVKYAYKHGNKKDEVQFTVPSSYLFIPSSVYSAAKLQLTDKYGMLLIATEDYHFEGVFQCVDGTFPNYPKVIPEINENTEWINLCAASFQMTIDSVKGLMGKDNIIYLDAKNPENLSITVADGSATLEVEGTASRPMRLSFNWEHIQPSFFSGMALTKFMLNGSGEAFLSHSTKPVRGLVLDVTKIFMPTRDDCKDCDVFRIPKKAE